MLVFETPSSLINRPVQMPRRTGRSCLNFSDRFLWIGSICVNVWFVYLHVLVVVYFYGKRLGRLFIHNALFSIGCPWDVGIFLQYLHTSMVDCCGFSIICLLIYLNRSTKYTMDLVYLHTNLPLKKQPLT